jgi:hypothetical protein
MGDEQDIAAVMQAAEAAENRRREVGSRAPGLGVLMPLDQPPNGPSVGKYGLPGLDITGESYDVLAPDDAQQRKAYGMVRPHYADALVAGLDYRPAAGVPVRRSIIDAGLDGLWIEAAPGPASPGNVIAVSPQAAPRRSLLGRVTRWLRRR